MLQSQAIFIIVFSGLAKLAHIETGRENHIVQAHQELSQEVVEATFKIFVAH